MCAAARAGRAGGRCDAPAGRSGGAPPPHRLRERVEHGLGLRPAQARVGDRHAVLQRHAGLQVLPAGLQVALDHHAGDASLAVRQLAREVLGDVDLPQVRLVRIRVRAVDHHLLALARRAQHRARLVDARAIVVRAPLAAAQDHVRGVVAARLENRGHPHLRHAHERVARARRDDRVGRDLHAAVGAVLEADRAAQPRRELPVALALGRARADRAPGDQIRDVLRAQQIEEFGAGGQAERVDVDQQPARGAQPFVDAEAAVEARIVDVALPADRRARLLEIHAHHDQQVVAQRVGGAFQPARVVERLIVIVDRARADDREQAVVAAVQHVADRVAARFDERLDGARHRQFVLQQRGRDERAHRADAHVVDARRVLRRVGEAGFPIALRIVDVLHGGVPVLRNQPRLWHSRRARRDDRRRVALRCRKRARGRLATHAAAQAATGTAARGRLFFGANVSNPAAFGRRDVVAARWRRARPGGGAARFVHSRRQQNARDGHGEGDERIGGGQAADAGTVRGDGPVQRGAREGRRDSRGRRPASECEGQAGAFLGQRAERDRRAVCANRRARRRVLAVEGRFDGRSRRMGEAMPESDGERFGNRNPAAVRARGFRRCIHARAARAGGAAARRDRRAGQESALTPRRGARGGPRRRGGRRFVHGRCSVAAQPPFNRRLTAVQSPLNHRLVAAAPCIERHRLSRIGPDRAHAVRLAFERERLGADLVGEQPSAGSRVVPKRHVVAPVLPARDEVLDREEAPLDCEPVLVRVLRVERIALAAFVRAQHDLVVARREPERAVGLLFDDDERARRRLARRIGRPMQHDQIADAAGVDIGPLPGGHDLVAGRQSRQHGRWQAGGARGDAGDGEENRDRRGAAHAENHVDG
ncbi:hypothetical protein BURPS1710b_A0311 [Burkholderia pseudomallei 1710b]|uniref:Uncharacterized protein n=1 Tax=Burkholderia pseudomallei (strain 1710b) TaxID=320372 RepID=Q3JLT5_BURP1|nr:hypothetical protein BURPS1710b_A0311 [Burkholderia pseudomallei 1710b]